MSADALLLRVPFADSLDAAFAGGENTENAESIS